VDGFFIFNSRMKKAQSMFSMLSKVTLLTILASTSIGCGSGESTVPFTDDSKDADAYALSVKQAVADQVASAATSSEPADQVSVLVSLLEDKGNRPAGPHEAIYGEILTAAQMLTVECQAAPNGRPDGLDKSLEDLAAISNKLPGTVKEAEQRED